MKQSIQLRLSQQLTITPQLQQAIRLLQLSILDLQHEIQEALDSNLMLETAEEADNAGGEPGETPTTDNEQATKDAIVEREVKAESSMPDELPVDSEWGDHFEIHTPIGGGGDSDDYDIFARRSPPQTLHDHLDWQLNLSRLGGTDMAIATAVVDAIDDDGYLRTDAAELLDVLDAQDLTVEEIEAVIHRIQALDPPGVGARSLSECLLIQLRQLPEDVPGRTAAIRICEEFFEALSKGRFDTIGKALGLETPALSEAVELIRSLNPRPGGTVADSQPEYVIPDVFVRKYQGQWIVELNPETTPTLRVNAEYANLMRRATRSGDAACFKSHLQEARWFIKSLASRNDTVLRVATKIVELQRDFFEYGEEAMKPLVLRDVADALELHESTVSRVTTQKYMHTPRGTFEFKYFFSSHVSTASGGECSSTAIRAVIRKMIAAETPSQPLSDNKITGLLADQGIKVARRTVAKYREAMGIPPSNERKRPA